VIDASWRPNGWHRVAVVVGALCSLVLAILLVGWLDSLDRRVLLARNVGLLAVLALPLALAVASLWRRPILLVPAATFSILFSPMLWSGLPLLFVPGVLYLIAFLKTGTTEASGLQIGAAVVLPLTLGFAAVALLFGDTASRCAEERSASAFRSTCAQVPSTASVAGTALLVVAGVGASVYVASPGRSTSRPASEPVSTGPR
jgi:hypothetical protein